MFQASQVERVIRHLVRFGSSRADAEDLAQEALVIAWRKQGELDRDRSLDAWLYGIARNVHRNHLRSERRRAMIDDPAEPTADARDLADVVAFRDALGALPEAQQDIVILHELEEYTLKETAELLSIPFDTAKDRLRRAREVLRERLHGDLATAAANERRAASQLAKAAAPAVLVGVLAAVSRSAAAAGAGAAAGTAAATGGATASSAALGGVAASKLLLVAALVTGVIIGIVADRVVARATTPAVTAPSTSARESAPPRPAASADAATTDAATDAAPDAATADSPPSPQHASAPAQPAANPEAQLIERARVALRRGSADEALRTLMSHERRFPDGQLAEERDILLVEAYLAAGKLELARERLDHYRASYPDGLHQQRAADAAREIERRLPR